jgi:hypothetical protein
MTRSRRRRASSGGRPTGWSRQGRTTATPDRSRTLRAFAHALGGHYLARGAAAEGQGGPRAALAAFHRSQMLVQVGALCAAAMAGAEELYAVDLAS